MKRAQMIALAAAALAVPGTAAMAQTPAMTRQQAMALYAAGGFPISADGKSPTNRCGSAATPRITFVDMNADGRREALFIDAGPCYRPETSWYALATQDAAGQWRRIAEGAGTVRATGTRANGWFVLSATSGGKTQTLTYNGQAYAAGTAAAPVPGAPGKAGGAASATAPRPAPAPTPTPAPAPGTASAQRDAAIFRAAGLKQIRGRWESGCNDPSVPSPYDPGTIEQPGDLNGDGRPEALVIEGGSYCYGNTGQAFWLVSQQADGSWKQMHFEVGIAEFLKTKGVGGWPDISVGGPGFCFRVVRWNGTAYVRHRYEYEGKPCRLPS